MANTKKLTILHSNDMHGDFLAEEGQDRLVGGVSMLSGYINKVRCEEENVIYCVSGDMFTGSLIDSEFKGISTIQLMNVLGPDVVTLGNHEVDYGIAHLLFLEKCAKFPIVNANMYIKFDHMRLFNSHYIKEIDGMKVLFIGILTEDAISQTKSDGIIGTMVDIEEAACEIGKICNSYRGVDIDFTVLLTHIGFEEDQKLAALLDPEWGVDIIIGGHSHTLIDRPAVVNGIPIVQAATGTDQIGRFDIVVDTDNNCIESYEWNLIPIDDRHCPRDPAMEQLIERYKTVTDQKYSRYLTRFPEVYTHPRRDRETQLGKIFADALAKTLELDIMMVGSGSLRKTEMGPIVDYRSLCEMYPYIGKIYRIVIDGKALKKMINRIFRPEVFDGIHTEFYQFSGGIKFIVNNDIRKVIDIKYNEQPISDDQTFSVGLADFHFVNKKEFLDLDDEDVNKYKAPRIAATNDMDVLDEYFSKQETVICPRDNRWITIDNAGPKSGQN